MSNIILSLNGILRFNGKEYRCALGKEGIKNNKIEGDGATPAGCFPIRKVYFRPDKFEQFPKIVFPTQALSPNDGWSSDVDSPEYNTFIKLPYIGSHEKLWRADDLYDIIVVLGYNDSPVIPHKGSAIFLHIARENYTPTDGCIALSKSDLLEILKSINAETLVCISESG